MRPRIAVIGMGGSLSTPARHKLDLFEYGQYARPARVEDVLAMFSDVLVDFDILPVPFHAIDSAALDPPLWLELNREISRVGCDPAVRGIVLIHGTSTLEETAYFLHLAVRVPLPIVVVGAQRPPNGLGSDAGINLLNGLRVAASEEARGLGVLVVMADEIHSARDVTKSSNFRLHAFRTPDLGVLGSVEPDGAVAIYRRSVRRHAPDTEFDVGELRELPAVEIVYSYAGASPHAVEAFVAAGAKGIVVAGTPPGRPSPAQRVALVNAVRAGALVVQCSRAGSGKIAQRGDDRAAGFVAGDNLNPQKARVLAMLALSRTSDRATIARMFEQY
jgi:L-asparaginase